MGMEKEIGEESSELREPKELSVKLPVELHVKLHTYKVLMDRNISDTVQEALYEFFDLRSAGDSPDTVEGPPHFELAELTYRLESLEAAVHAMTKRQEAISEDLGVILGSPSIHGSRLHRYLPVKVYADTDDPHIASALESGIRRVLTEFDFEIVSDPPAETGSWIKRMLGRSEDRLTSGELKTRLAKIEQAIEARHLRSHQAQADKEQSTAASILLDALSQTPDAVCQIGTLLIVKLTDDGKPSIISRTLGPDEIALVEEDPTILERPRTILKELSGEPASDSLEAEVAE